MLSNEKPKYLTEELVRQSIVCAWEIANKYFKLKRDHAHAKFSLKTKNGTLYDFVSLDLGDNLKKDCDYEFDKIATSKIHNMYNGYTDGSHRVDVTDLYPGEYPYYGGCEQDGFYCAVSSEDEYHDEFIAKLVINLVITKMKEVMALNLAAK